MEIELVPLEIELAPDPGTDSPVTRAVIAALTGPGHPESAFGLRSMAAWRRAGLEEAVESSNQSETCAARTRWAARCFVLGRPDTSRIGRLPASSHRTRPARPGDEPSF